MTDENEEIAKAECGSCRAVVPIDSENCPECGISFSGVSEDALGECGACNALVPLDSTKCPECGVVFVADDVVDILRTWMATNSMDVKTLFGRFDTNGDGRIDSDELKSGLLSLNLADLPPSQVDKLIQAIDEDGDSLVDLDELQSIIGGEDLPVDVSPEESEEESEEEVTEEEESEEELADEDESEEEVTEEDESEEELTEEEEQPEEEVVEEESDEVTEEPDEQTEEEESVEEIIDEEYAEEVVTEDRNLSQIYDDILDSIDEQDLTLSNAFGNMDEDGDRMITRVELGSKLSHYLDYELSESELDAMMDSMDENSDGNIDMIEFVTSIENHEDSISSIDDEEAETVKTFPTKWHTRFMSKQWHDVFWPLIHTGLVIMIIAALANGLFPFVDGEGGTVELETEAGDGWMNADGIVIDEGQAYPCEPTVQVGECKNSLTPLAGDASSMPGGFYLDGIFLMLLSTIGLIGSLYTHLVLAPSWRARVKAMKEVSEDKADIQESLEDDNVIEESGNDQEADESETEDSDDVESESEETDDDLDEEESNSENEELDIGSYVGVDIDGEEYYGTIVEFDDDEETVTIEEEESGDEITAYQDEMFVPED